MPDEPTQDDSEVEIVCPRCGYRMARTAARLRRETQIMCPQCGTTVAPRSDEEEGTR